MKRLSELEKLRNEISDAIAKEKLQSPIFTQDHFRMAFHNFRKVDISKQEGKRKIIDTFINAIYVFDDHIKIVYNGNGKEEIVSLEELESSTLFSDGAPRRTKATFGSDRLSAVAILLSLVAPFPQKSLLRKFFLGAHSHEPLLFNVFCDNMTGLDGGGASESERFAVKRV